MTNKEHLILHLLMARNIRGYVKRLQEPEGHGDYWKGYNSALNDILSFIDSLQEEPVSDGLEDVADKYSQSIHSDYFNDMFDSHNIYDAVIYGAKWQKEQFEKNRLKHCNSITNEQVELEQGFIDQHLDKYRRMPTFLDAIEYGMRLQKEQMMKSVLKVTDEGKEKEV